MTSGKTLTGKQGAGNPHLWFDRGKVVPTTTSSRGILPYNTVKKLAAMLFVIFVGISLMALETRLPTGEKGRITEEQNAILDTIAQINHINWVVNVIKTYDNAMILEEEYEKISYGNLNLNRIPDEEARGRITNMLDTLYSLRKDEREMKHWRDKFWDDRMRKMREYDLGTAKRVWGLFREGILGFMTYDIGTVLQTAFDVGHGCLSLQYDYDNFVHSFDQEMQERVFAFDSQKMALLHKLNKEMLDDQWRLMQKYHLDDKATRVTDTDIKALLSVLKDGNASRIYTRLVSMKSRYRLFPEYWYYLSCAAMETGHFKEGRDACDTFFKVNRGIFRDDPMAGTVALNKALMLDKEAANLPELRKCLEITWENNQNRNEWAQDFIIASLYDGILHDNKKAVEILEHAIAGLESEMSERRRKNKSIAYLARTLGKYHAFLFRLLPDEPIPAAIRTSEYISFSDKLRFLARSKTDNLWETIKDDVLGVSFDFDYWDGYVTVTVPASWLLNEDVPVKVAKLRSDGEWAEMDEQVLRRSNKDDKSFILKFKFKINNDKSSLIWPFFLLGFDHPDFPVVLLYAINGLKTHEKWESLFLFRIFAFDKLYLWQPESGLDTPSYSSDVTPQQMHNAFLSKYPLVPLETGEFVCPDAWTTNGIKPVKVKSGKTEITVEYRNVSQKKIRPNVSFVLMNEYGMLAESESDTYFDKYTRSERTVPGLIFDDHYVDYNYRYMSPNETRTFTITNPGNAKYMWIYVREANYELKKTYKN